MNILFLIYLKDKRSARQCPAAFLPSFSEFPLRIGSCAHICQSFTEKKKEHWVTSEKLLTQCNSVIILCAVSLKKNQECKISINSLEVMMVSLSLTLLKKGFFSWSTLFRGKKKKKKKKKRILHVIYHDSTFLQAKMKIIRAHAQVVPAMPLRKNFRNQYSLHPP
uniref:Putative uncharacterized protein YHR095W n=1 Tax=Saccharomyces cerevisiae (strain ATCC 204508 / S288c) TaxID=559292 RepID=YHP5_YEAST|nr:RecName: Full=Putative uncharacterized protein YHR095W [Saccharomyces cerevisiae S288C]